MPRIADVLESESRTVDLEQGDFERLLGRRGRKERNRRIRAGALGVIVALAMGIVLVRSLASDGVPADRTEPTPAAVSGALAYELDGDIFVADPDGTNAVKIAAGGALSERCEGIVGYYLPSWSPDGRYLAFDRQCWESGSGKTISDAMLISEPDGTVLAEIPVDVAYFAGWSPDSTRVALWETFGRTIGVYGVNGEQQALLPVPLIAGGAAEGGPVWTLDGSALLVSGPTPTTSAVVPLDGSPVYERSGGLPIPSPNGTRAAVQGDLSIVITDADGVHVLEVDVPLRGAVWSPDGDRFASVSRRGELVVVDATSGDVTVVLEAGAALPKDGVLNVVRGFSPQGDRILFAALVRDGGVFYNSLFSVSVEGSDVRLLVDGSMQGQWRPR